MSGFVLDGSTTLAALLPDERTVAAFEILARASRNGEAMAPAIWPFEVANGLLQAERRGRITERFRRERLQDLAQLSVEIDAGATALAWSAVSKLAERHRLTVYDAAYLELAIRLGLPLATCDRDLRSAANREDIEPL
jgi:predicted nucleic acid-binding protein